MDVTDIPSSSQSKSHDGPLILEIPEDPLIVMVESFPVEINGSTNQLGNSPTPAMKYSDSKIGAIAIVAFPLMGNFNNHINLVEGRIYKPGTSDDLLLNVKKGFVDKPYSSRSEIEHDPFLHLEAVKIQFKTSLLN